MRFNGNKLAVYAISPAQRIGGLFYLGNYKMPMWSWVNYINNTKDREIMFCAEENLSSQESV